MVLPLVLVLALAILAAGCGGDNSTTQSTPTVPPPTTQVPTTSAPASTTPAAANTTTPAAPASTTAAETTPVTATPVVTTPAAVTTTPPETQSSAANDIITASLAANEKASTVKMAVDMEIGIETIGGDAPGKMALKITGTGASNLTEKKMQASLSMNMDIPQMGKVTIGAETYIIDGWTYTKIDSPMMGAQWSKKKLTDEEWKDQNDVNELMGSAKSSKLVGTEVVNGIACDVVEIVPDDAVIEKWLKTQVDAQTTGTDISSVDLSKKYTKFVVTDYIAKDSRRIVKESIDISFELTSADLPNSTSKFDKMVYSFTGASTYSDFDKPVTITLPAEAANASEMPGT